MNLNNRLGILKLKFLILISILHDIQDLLHVYTARNQVGMLLFLVQLFLKMCIRDSFKTYIFAKTKYFFHV